MRFVALMVCAEDDDVVEQKSIVHMHTVLLTATVSPNVTGWLAVTDASVRLSHYQHSVKYWYHALRDTSFRLAITETSGADEASVLDLLSENERRDVLYVPFAAEKSVIDRGKGAIEMAAVRSFLSSPGLTPASTLYKCTGRLPLVNVRQCIHEIEPNHVRVRMTLDRSWADTRLLGATAATWLTHILKADLRIDDRSSTDAERVVASNIAAGLALHELALNRFRARPLFAGVSGTSGKNYSPAMSRLRDAALSPAERLLALVASRKQV